MKVRNGKLQKQRVRPRQLPRTSPPRPFPADRLRPHLSVGNLAALTSRIIPAAALGNRLKPGTKRAETQPGPFPSSPPPTHLGSSGAGSNCSCHSLTLTNRRGHSDRLPLKPACSTNTESSGAGSEETGSSVSLAMDGPSLPQSGPAQPHLDGASAPP